jgi:hypothetical protein
VALSVGEIATRLLTGALLYAVRTFLSLSAAIARCVVVEKINDAHPWQGFRPAFYSNSEVLHMLPRLP